MISCTEFIPAYSEGFKFLEACAGPDEPSKFWNWISGHYLDSSLDSLMRHHGLEGCFVYWEKTLNEEAADFRMVLDEIAGEFSIEVYKCPSKGMLNEMKHIVPYHSYCAHCSALYRPVAEKNGYKYHDDLTDSEKAACKLKISLKR